MAMLDTSELTRAISNDRQRRQPDEDVIERFRGDESLEIPIELTDLDVWANYMSDDIYEMDVKVREFLKRTRYQRQAKGGYRTTCPMVFAWIFGHQPGPRDGAACRLIHTLLKYYCTSYTGQTTMNGKPVSRVYRFNKYASNSKRPYSLRLRLEEAKGGSTDAVFKNGPGSKSDKRTHGRRADRQDG